MTSCFRSYIQFTTSDSGAKKEVPPLYPLSLLTMFSKVYLRKRKVECSDCGEILVNRQVTEGHKKSVHSDDMPLKCAECETFFKQSGNLKLHMISHSDERSFPCSYCNHSFKRKSELNKHVKKQSCKKEDLEYEAKKSNL